MPPMKTGMGWSATNISQRVAFAKRMTIMDLKSKIKLLQDEIESLKKENRLLNHLQHRQDTALKKWEGKDAELPKLLSQHKDEIRSLKEHLRRAQRYSREHNEKLSLRDKKILKLENELEKLRSIVEEENLLDRHTLQQELDMSRMNLAGAEKRIAEYMRHCDILEKNYRHQIAAQNRKLIKVNTSTYELQHVVANLRLALRNKDRMLNYIQMRSSGRTLIRSYHADKGHSEMIFSFEADVNRGYKTNGQLKSKSFECVDSRYTTPPLEEKVNFPPPKRHSSDHAKRERKRNSDPTPICPINPDLSPRKSDRNHKKNESVKKPGRRCPLSIRSLSLDSIRTSTPPPPPVKKSEKTMTKVSKSVAPSLSSSSSAASLAATNKTKKYASKKNIASSKSNGSNKSTTKKDSNHKRNQSVERPGRDWRSGEMSIRSLSLDSIRTSSPPPHSVKKSDKLKSRESKLVVPSISASSTSSSSSGASSATAKEPKKYSKKELDCSKSKCSNKSSTRKDGSFSKSRKEIVPATESVTKESKNQSHRLSSIEMQNQNSSTTTLNLNFSYTENVDIDSQCQYSPSPLVPTYSTVPVNLMPNESQCYLGPREANFQQSQPSTTSFYPYYSPPPLASQNNVSMMQTNSIYDQQSMASSTRSYFESMNSLQSQELQQQPSQQSYFETKSSTSSFPPVGYFSDSDNNQGLPGMNSGSNSKSGYDPNYYVNLGSWK